MPPSRDRGRRLDEPPGALTRGVAALGYLALFGLLGWYLAFLFHVEGLRLPSAGIGSWADPYFVNFVLEQWVHAARTLSDPASPPMYHPIRGTLGYSHSLILFAPLYIAARAGLHPFQAETFTLIVVFGAGAVSLFVMLRVIGVRALPAAALTALVVSSPNVIHSGTETWMQRASFYLVPPILGLGVYALARRRAAVRAALAAAFGFAVVSLLTHDAYTGLFFMWVAAALCLGTIALDRWPFVRHLWRTAIRPPSGAARAGPSRVWLWAAAAFLLLSLFIAFAPIDRTTLWGWRFSATDPMRPLRLSVLAAAWYLVRQLRWPGVGRAGQAMRRSALVLLTAAARRFAPAADVPGRARSRLGAWLRGLGTGALMGTAVFLWLYGRGMLEYQGFAPEQIHDNMMPIEPGTWHDLSSLWRDLFIYDSVRPFVIVGVSAALAWLPMFRVPPWARRLGLTALALSVFVWIVPLRLGDFSLWAGVTAVVPGTSVVRDPKRIMYLYELAAVGVAALLAAQAGRKRLLFEMLVAGTCIVLLTLGWHSRRFGFARAPDVFEAVVRPDIVVDPGCRSFFVLTASDRYMARSDNMWVLYGMDAAFIAQRLGLPTLNGYSAFHPPGWMLANPQEPGYLDGVRAWIARHHLTNVCALDLEARSMTRFE